MDTLKDTLPKYLLEITDILLYSTVLTLRIKTSFKLHAKL